MTCFCWSFLYSTVTFVSIYQSLFTPKTQMSSSVLLTLVQSTHTRYQVCAGCSFKRQICFNGLIESPYSSPSPIHNAFGASTLCAESESFASITSRSNPSWCACVIFPTGPSGLRCYLCFFPVIEDHVSRFPVVDFWLCYQATPVNLWISF